ncbi:MAG: pimeloyl-ACP methyl ester carboxylesterase [Flavobacteriaceae bacterium]|jgi:pimeloyl-ACP methyl ester carboxylesterase
MTLNYYETPIYYEIHGIGPAIVLLHGFLESLTMWEPLIPILSKNKTVIAIDLPGFGKSGIVDTVHSMELMANIVDQIITLHSFETISIMGHSMGGYVGLAYSEIYPTSINNLILLNSTPAADSQERKINRERALRLIDKNSAVFLTMVIQNLFTKDSQEKYASEIEKMKDEALSFPLEGIKAAISGMKNRKDRTSVLTNFQGEKMMICGRYDPVIPYKVSTTLAKKTLTPIIKLNGGHMGMVENFNEIVKIIT